MIQHLITLIWNRKRANGLLITELFLSFLVLFGLGTLVAVVGLAMRQPPGFAYEDVWELRLTTNNDQLPQNPTLRRLLAQLRAVPGVEGVSRSSFSTPFTLYNMQSNVRAGNGPILEGNEVQTDDHFGPLLRMELLEGRWFDPRDDASLVPPVIINREMREALFPNGPALGQLVRANHSSNPKEMNEGRVVGVTGSYRSGGDLGAPSPFIFVRTVLPDSNVTMFSHTLLVRVRPGSGAALEEQLVKTVAAVTKTWSTSAISLTDSRAAGLQTALAPILAVGLVCAFLFLNVALGLFGALWQAISQRRAEIGLRRAVGATGPGISRQFVAETLVITTLAVGPGVLLAAQFPLLGAFGLPVSVYAVGIGLAVLLVYAFATVCAMQPSWQAAGIRPAVALREE
ncbi:ABC transporter permease [Hymenobacter arizonensis]|uniref:Putative ABC transport system permease protein n=1 Tax=Hymenobacter arizonensis TaxID=1227077 RepID=A0A1I5XKR6_HYMAR|nr:ABC transporter permease [Hymenobacter arizonensis]SFQ32572.1 putative ABC transport system permease protein [Hymenobacter arizonensis]